MKDEKNRYIGLLDQYKLYVEMTDRISSRRIQTNRFYISLLSGLLALLYVFAGKSTSSFLPIVTLAIGIISLVLCCLWVVNLRSYRQLNEGKKVSLKLSMRWKNDYHFLVTKENGMYC